MIMSFAPKIATLVDVLLRPRLRAAYGGGLRIACSALLETVLTMLVAPISAVAVSLFILGLPFGRRVGWTSQQREAHGLPLSEAVRCLWPQTLLGLGLAAGTCYSSAVSLWFSLPIIAGLLLGVPLAMLSASPRLGRKMAQSGLCRTPEEVWPQFALGTGPAAATPNGAGASPASLFAGRADPSIGTRP
jgi:membrane glycosyltransferase